MAAFWVLHHLTIACVRACAQILVCVSGTVSTLRSLVSCVINANYISNIVSLPLRDQDNTHIHTRTTAHTRMHTHTIVSPQHSTHSRSVHLAFLTLHVSLGKPGHPTNLSPFFNSSIALFVLLFLSLSLCPRIVSPLVSFLLFFPFSSLYLPMFLLGFVCDFLWLVLLHHLPPQT